MSDRVVLSGDLARVTANVDGSSIKVVVRESTGGGGGAVDSVNGRTGAVVLAASDVGAATPADVSSAVSAHVSAVDPHGDRAHADAVAAAAQAASQPVDSDLTAIAALSTTAFGRALLEQLDASALRTVAGLGTAATRDVGVGAGTVAAGNDARLSDARTPTAHTHAAADITSGVLPIARIATGTPDGTKFVRDDGTLATPSGGLGSITSQRILGRVTAGSGAVEQLTGSQARGLLGLWSPSPPSGAWVPLTPTMGVAGTAFPVGATAVQSNELAIWQWFPTATDLVIDRIRWYLNTANGGASAVATFIVYAPDGANGGPGTRLVAASGAINGAAGEKEVTLSTTLSAPGVWWALVPMSVDTGGANPSFWGFARQATGMWGPAPSGNNRRPQMYTTSMGSVTNNPTISTQSVPGSTTDAPGMSVRLA